MALAQKKASLDKCPHVTPEAKIVLESASQPPIKLVTIGVGDKKLEMGNETVMYRHEQKFYHPAGIGLLIEDTLTEDQLAKKITEINDLVFDRVGQVITPDLICLKNSSGNKDAFVKLVSKIATGTKLNMALLSHNTEALTEALKISKFKKPLIIWDGGNLDDFTKLALNNKVPLAVTCADAQEASSITDKVRLAGIEEIVISIKGKNVSGTIQDLTFMRRTALKKNARSLGYPLLAFTSAVEPYAELAESISYVLKYAGLVIVKNTDKDFILPLLVARQDVYSDPQKPVQVEPKVYEIGKTSKASPVIITTNFSITYFTVAGEVEASKVPTYILCCDAEGMSVLTAWAAEKFTPESINEQIVKIGCL
jgi:CO dehydrogenase/acetyl-CoA synthase gamma subunit (corrinoid Fe-S protein)